MEIIKETSTILKYKLPMMNKHNCTENIIIEGNFDEDQLRMKTHGLMVNRIDDFLKMPTHIRIFLYKHCLFSMSMFSNKELIDEICDDDHNNLISRISTTHENWFATLNSWRKYKPVKMIRFIMNRVQTNLDDLVRTKEFASTVKKLGFVSVSFCEEMMNILGDSYESIVKELYPEVQQHFVAGECRFSVKRGETFSSMQSFMRKYNIWIHQTRNRIPTEIGTLMTVRIHDMLKVCSADLSSSIKAISLRTLMDYAPKQPWAVEMKLLGFPLTKEDEELWVNLSIHVHKSDPMDFMKLGLEVLKFLKKNEKLFFKVDRRPDNWAVEMLLGGKDTSKSGVKVNEDFPYYFYTKTSRHLKFEEIIQFQDIRPLGKYSKVVLETLTRLGYKVDNCATVSNESDSYSLF
jgi:hypothetical protein